MKVNFAQSNYINDLSSNLTKSLLSFITRNHRLPIETGRWNNTVINERKCVNCDDVGDEFHYLFKCNTFTNERHKYLNRYYYNRPNTQKLRELFNNENKDRSYTFKPTLKSLDYFLTGRWQLDLFEKCDVITDECCTVSDHLPLITTINMPLSHFEVNSVSPIAWN